MARVTIAPIGRPLYASSRCPGGGCISSAFADPNHRNGIAWKFAEHAFQYLDANHNTAGKRLYRPIARVRVAHHIRNPSTAWTGHDISLFDHLHLVSRGNSARR